MLIISYMKINLFKKTLQDIINNNYLNKKVRFSHLLINLIEDSPKALRIL